MRINVAVMGPAFPGGAFSSIFNAYPLDSPQLTVGSAERYTPHRVGPMTRRVKMLYGVLVFFFTLCQVIGTTCTLPDLSMAAGAAPFLEEGMACPMEGATMCPPSLSSSPERQIKPSMVWDVDHAPVLLSVSTALTGPFGPGTVVREQRVIHCSHLYRFFLGPSNLIRTASVFRSPLDCVGRAAADTFSQRRREVGFPCWCWAEQRKHLSDLYLVLECDT